MVSAASIEFDGSIESGDSYENEKLIESLVLRRKQPLSRDFPKDWTEQITSEALSFIELRFSKMQSMVSVSDYQLNVFLLLMMAPAYNIHSPYDLAGHIQTGPMAHGDSTAFGRFVEDKVFPIFGVRRVPEKSAAATQDLFSPIDAEMDVEGTTYYTTWKSGPWTMNQSHANEMSANFPTIYERYGREIILGIFYGRYKQLNNKPAYVARRTGSYFHTLVGSDLWEFVTGVEGAHRHVLEAIREAQGQFAERHGGKTFFEHMLESRLVLTQSIRDAFDIDSGDDELWKQVIENGF